MTMINLSRPFVNGQWLNSEGREGWDIINPYSKQKIGTQIVATSADVELALTCAYKYRKKIESLPAHTRANILQKAASLLEERKDQFALLISTELGKPLKNTVDEVARSIETLQLSAEEAKRLHGETINGDASERGEEATALTFRVPVGVVAAITPFNAPLNLVCHKVGPSFAGGNVTILKPAPQTSLIATAFVELLLEAGLPSEAIQMVLGGVEPGQQIVSDARVNVISFTGGVIAARHISKQAGMKKVLLELGGNAGTIVNEDANIDRAAKMCVQTGFSNSGQSCISVQRIYVHEKVVERFVEKMQEYVSQLIIGDPTDPATDVGTLVDENAASRIISWIQQAIETGAELVAGGKQNGANVEPTILVRPAKTSNVVCQEVFGPIVSIIPIASFEEGINEINNSDYGLQAGVFTNRFDLIQKATLEIEAGGVVINGTSNFRLDHWPYGGVKNSGIGREGPRFAIQELTEMKMIVLRK